jgi:hypothetical protein
MRPDAGYCGKAISVTLPVALPAWVATIGHT